VRQIAPLLIAAALAVGAVSVDGPAVAQTVPPHAVPTPVPTPSPSPAPKHHPFSLGIDTYTSAVNQQFTGPGTTPAYGPGFQANPPTTPYSFFTNGTNTTGQGLSFDLILKPRYVIGGLAVSASFGYGSLGGSGNAISYWGDAPMATINPFLGSRAYQIMPQFTTHNGQDDVQASRLSVLSGSIGTADGSASLTAGWFDPKISVPFVFSPVPWVNTPTQIVPTVPHSIGDPSPSIDTLKQGYQYYPLQGADIYGQIDNAKIEFLDANLPAPYDAPARVDSLAVVIDRGSGGPKYSASYASLSESGPDTGRFLWGSDPSITEGNTGPVPLSTVFAQRMTIFGLGASAPIPLIGDGEVRYAQSCYGADGAVVTTTQCTVGNYYYAKLHHGFRAFDLSAEYVRFEPRFAPAVLNFGTIPNTWQTPFAWPGDWLPGTYQFVDNSEFSANRQGYRFSATTYLAGVQMRFAYGTYQQVESYDAQSAFTPGFVEPYFLPQLSGTPGTLGRQQQASAWFGWSSKYADVALDLTDVTVSRAGTPGNPEETVAMNYPAYVLSFSRHFGKLFGAAGFGRIAAYGSYNSVGPANADLAQNAVFAGVQFQQNANTGYGLQWTMYSVNGSATVPGAFPAYHGPQIQFYQRLKT
jgi:hypothetical protein